VYSAGIWKESRKELPPDACKGIASSRPATIRTEHLIRNLRIAG
jgi:hypothetical protein